MRADHREKVPGADGLAFSASEQTAFRPLEAWAAGYRLNSGEVVAGIEAVLLAAASADAVPDHLAGAPVLIEREREVLTLLAAGRTKREIGEMLFISHRTVNKHVGNILTRLGGASRESRELL